MNQNIGRTGGLIVRAVQSWSPAAMATCLHWIPWRTKGREIFACIDPEDIEGVNDKYIGRMVNEKVAEEAVMAHNTTLRSVDSDA